MYYTSLQLAQHPGFILTLQQLARSLRVVYDQNPRLAHLFASHQRWLLSQAAIALHMEYDEGQVDSGLTAARLKKLIVPLGIASRNTVLNFLELLASYRFVLPAATQPLVGRSKRYVASEMTRSTLFRWYVANLRALDSLDKGDRAHQMLADPDIFDLAQPRLARACLETREWREPSPRVSMFLWTEGAGLVIDELIARIGNVPGHDHTSDADRMAVGHVDAKLLASHFMMSRTHLQRLFKKGFETGSLGWYDEKSRDDMWLSSSFMAEYTAWQAIKFSAADEAFFWAKRQLAERRTVRARVSRKG